MKLLQDSGAVKIGALACFELCSFSYKLSSGATCHWRWRGLWSPEHSASHLFMCCAWAVPCGLAPLAFKPQPFSAPMSLTEHSSVGWASFSWLTYWREKAGKQLELDKGNVLSADVLKYAKELCLSRGLCSHCCDFFQLHTDFADFCPSFEFL